MEQRVCDRCGKTLHNNYYAGTLEQNSFLMFCNKKYGFDLCDDCQKDFMKFLSKRADTEAIEGEKDG